MSENFFNVKNYMSRTQYWKWVLFSMILYMLPFYLSAYFSGYTVLTGQAMAITLLVLWDRVIGKWSAILVNSLFIICFFLFPIAKFAHNVSLSTSFILFSLLLIFALIKRFNSLGFKNYWVVIPVLSIVFVDILEIQKMLVNARQYHLGYFLGNMEASELSQKFLQKVEFWQRIYTNIFQIFFLLVGVVTSKYEMDLRKKLKLPNVPMKEVFKNLFKFLNKIKPMRMKKKRG